MKLRRLTPDGIAEFEAYLRELKTDSAAPVPNELLAHPELSATLTSLVHVERAEFASRFDAAAYLDAKLSEARYAAPERDAGLWAWLSLFFFSQLCPANTAGDRKIGEVARYVPSTHNFQRFYRHLLLGPFMIFRAHADDPERARGVLATPLHAPGDIAEQLASRQELITNASAMSVVTTLYIDSATGLPKRGSAGKGPGSARRLADFLNQLDVTFDLYAMRPENLLAAMPKEFDKFKRGNAPVRA